MKGKLTTKQRLRAYIETLEAEQVHCRTNEDIRLYDRIIAKLKDIVRRS